MVKTGEWITPQIGYTPHFTKPPLTYWLIASGLSMFGMNEWGARFAHAVAFALTAIVVALLGKRMWGHREGILAGAIYATSLTPFIAGNIVTADTILACFETLAVGSFWMSVTGRNSRRSFFWTLAMWGFFGLAFLTKGPAGLVPLGAVVVFILVAKNVRRPSRASTLTGLAVFACTALPWFAVVVARHKGLLSYFVLHEFVGRVFTGEQHRYSSWFGPIQVYVPVLTLGALPWSALWPSLLRRSRPAVFTLSRWSSLRSRPKALFLGLWFSLPLLIFVLSSSRLYLYVLPLFVPLALVTTHSLAKQFPRLIAEKYRLTGRPALAIGILVLFLVSTKWILAYVPVNKDTRAMWYGIRDTIREKAGDSPYEIATVHASYDGLAFYSDSNVEYLGSGINTSAFIQQKESLEDEFDELSSTDYVHVFLTSRQYEKKIIAELTKRGIGYSIAEAPFGRILILCKIASPEARESVTRLAVLGDSGTGKSGQKMLGSTLYHIDQSVSLQGILLAGDNIQAWDGQGEPQEAYREYFEEPYAPLIGNGVPFYAALGNHDLKHVEFQVRYPLFHMDGRRYYSRIFGPNRVEVFFLDSSTIQQQDSPQIEWIERSLAKSTARWKVVVMHHPMYSTTKKGGSEALVHVLEPIFVRTGVDMVLSGHNHVYERLRPIKGIHYFTVGSSGRLDAHSLRPDDPERVAGNDEENVLLTLRFTDDGCRFTAYGSLEKVVDEGEIRHASVPLVENTGTGTEAPFPEIPEHTGCLDTSSGAAI